MMAISIRMNISTAVPPILYALDVRVTFPHPAL